jgi:SAM-dependent methyltransferase
VAIPKAAPVSFDRVANRYDETRGGEERGAAAAADLVPHLSGSGRLLEIGIGTGLVAAALATGGRSVLGIDVSTAMLGYARERIGGRVAVADAARLPFPDGTFQDVYAVHVLHLIEDQAPVFREAARVLRPGGRFLVGLNGGPPECRDEVVDLLAEMNDRIDPGRADRESPDRLVERAERAGFRGAGLFEGAERRTRLSAAAIARRLEERMTSSLWEVPEDQWQQVVVPVIERLHAIGDEPMEFVSRPSVLVLERA